MFAKDITINAKNTAQHHIELLERLFVFKNEQWKQFLHDSENDSIKYHLSIRVDNFEPDANSDSNQKLTVYEVRTQLWERDDNDGVNLLLILKIK